MELKIHNPKVNPIAELQSDTIEIETVQDALDLMGNSNYMGARKIIIKMEQLCSEFLI